MRWKPHVRFGGGPGGRTSREVWHRALVRPHLANVAIDDVRRRVQQEECGRRGRKGDPLYGIRRLLLRGSERLTDHARARLEAGLAAGDPGDEVLDAWLAKETLRWMYAADTMAEAARRFDAFGKEAKSSSAPELHRLAKTMFKWRTEILAHHRSGASNGPTEAVNLLIKEGAPSGARLSPSGELSAEAPSPLWSEVADSGCCEIRGRSPRLAA